MENSKSVDICGVGDGRIDDPDSSASRLSVDETMGGGRAMVWKRRHVSLGIVVVASVLWALIEHSGIPFLTLSSDVFLLLVILLFLRANCTKRQVPALPELVVSEEMINNAAASFRVKLNYLLLMAHDITLGKDFRPFFKVVIGFWVLSVVGGFISLVTLAYMGIIVSVTLPPLYTKFGGIIHANNSSTYTIVDDAPLKDKDA